MMISAHGDLQRIRTRQLLVVYRRMLMSTVQRRVARSVRWALGAISRAIAIRLLFQDLIHNPLSQIHAEAFSATNSLGKSLLENELGHICSDMLDDCAIARTASRPNSVSWKTMWFLVYSTSNVF